MTLNYSSKSHFEEVGTLSRQFIVNSHGGIKAAAFLTEMIRMVFLTTFLQHKIFLPGYPPHPHWPRLCLLSAMIGLIATGACVLTPDWWSRGPVAVSSLPNNAVQCVTGHKPQGLPLIGSNASF